MQKRPLNFGYALFFILFWPDTWRILIGIGVAFFVAPLIMPPDLGGFGSVMFYIMLACIGYAASALPGRAIARLLKRLILGRNHP